MPSFEVYRRQDSYTQRRRKGATVTVMHPGRLSFSRDALAALGNPKAIVYLVDREQRLLGFRAARPGSKEVAVVRDPGIAAAGPVLRYLNADLSVTRRYPLIHEDDYYYIDLKQPGAIVSSNRRGTGRP